MDKKNLNIFQANIHRLGPLNQDLIERLKNTIESKLASGFAKCLFKYIEEFEKSLDKDHEVGIRLVSFDKNLTINVSNIGYFNPSLIIFEGELEDGSKVKLIQHISQINFLLLAVKKRHKSKRKIGFQYIDKS